MSDSLTQLYLSNPALAQSLRRQQFAQGLIHQGTDASPASPMQALARVAQGALGAYMNYGADKDIQTAGDEQRKSRAAASATDMSLLSGGSLPTTSALGTALTQPSGPPPAQTPTGVNTSGVDPQTLDLIDKAAAARSIPSPLARALFKQESDFGRASPNLGQVIGSTAANPGFNMTPLRPEDVNNPAANVPFSLDYLKNVGTQAGVTDWNDPSQWSKALTPYNGGGDPQYVQHVLRHVGMTAPGVAATDAGGPPAAAGDGGAAPAMPKDIAAIPDQMLRAQALQKRAMDYASSGDPELQRRAPLLMTAAGQMLQVNKFVPEVVNGVAGQRDTLNNKWTPNFTAAPRFGTGPHGNTLIGNPGGGVTDLNDNPSGFKAGSPEQAIAELGDRVKNHTATPQEVANYNAAAAHFQNFETVTDPATNKIVRVAKTPLPEGAPQPNAAGNGATDLTQGGFGGKTAADITQTSGRADAKAISDEQTKILAGHNVLGTTQTIRSTLPQVTTGAAADQRLRAQQIFTALGVPDATAKEWTGTSAPMGEILQKKLFELSTGAVRGMGAREPGSVLQMFAKNYPNMTSRDMTIDSMTRLLDMDQVYKEAEVGSRSGHLQSSVQRLSQGQPYQGLTGYTAPDPRPFQAAALAAGGMPFSVWSHGLTPEQQAASLRLAAHVWPDAAALDANGVRHTFQAPAQ